MSNIIDSIRLSGTTYQIQGSGGGGTVDPSLDPTSTNPVENKAIYNKFDEVEQVTAAALNELEETVSGKQDELISGTNIKTINNESILGSGNIVIQGGGKTIEAGRGISITTGETADTVSFDLPISAGTGTNSIREGNISNIASGSFSHAEGNSTTASGNSSHAEGVSTTASGSFSHAEGTNTTASGRRSHAEGNWTTASGDSSHAEGLRTIAYNDYEHASGRYNISNSATTEFGDSGNTLFSVGNGTADDARHNAFEIRQNGDVYITSGNTDIKLQDHLGGSSITVDSALSPTSENPVQNKVIYNKIDEVEEVTAAGLNALNDKITPTVELTQAQYDALVDKDPNTYYIITDAQAGDLTNYYTKSETNTLLGGKANTATTYTKTEVDTALGGKQATLVSGTNIKTINNESILGSGNIDIQGGSTYTAGRGISIANDTISFSLPISAGTGSNSIIEGNGTKASGFSSHAEGSYSNARGSYSHAEGFGANANGASSHAEGGATNADGSYSHAEGDTTTAKGNYSHTEGRNTIANNLVEHASGQYNNSVSATTTFGDSGNTLFSVGNGTSNSARHNAFEIRQNGDIYLTLDGQDVKLQDQLGGSSITVDSALSSTSENPVQNKVIYNKIDEVEQVTAAALNELNDAISGKVDTSTYNTYTAATDTALTSKADTATTYTKTEVDTALGGKADTSAVTAIQDSLSGYVTTDTEQIISGRKIFTYTSSSNKAIEFKQTDDSSKVGFRVRTSAATNNELASFEFRPNTFTIDNVQHPLIYFGHYRTTNTANAGVPQTVIGFRQYDQKNAAAYHYLMPLPEKAKAPFSLTTTFKDYYAPMGFKNGSTMITADNTGVVDLSSELGGLKLKKLTQAEYNALATKDSSTLYIIVN